MCTICLQRRSFGMTTEEEQQQQQKQMEKRFGRRSCADHLLWKEFFRDPSLWWDNRMSKLGPRYPDFKHKVTSEPLWLDGCYNPSWVGEELRSRGLVLSSGFQKNEYASAALPEAGTQDEGAAFVALLRACTKNKDLYRGTRLHDDILRRGLLEKCSDALVIMYAKCGELGKAKALLEMHRSRDVIPWTALIIGYVRQGQGQNALDCFEHMQREGIPPNAVTYICVLKACAAIAAIDKGKEIHNSISRLGLLQNNIVLGNALVDMYAKCGALSKAQDVLENLPSRNVVSWSTLIAGYAQAGQGEQALDCFERMKDEDIPPNGVTYICILKACANIGAIDKGKDIHDSIAREGLLQSNNVLGTALVNMYAKCGALSKAQDVLEKMSSRNVVSWNALITGYAKEGQGEQALTCFEQMQREGIPPNAVTYICILKACATIGAADRGKEIHDDIARQGLLQKNIRLGNALVDMYAKCGALSKAQDVLEKLSSRDVVSWNALIAGYAQESQGEQALNCFECMQCEGIPPNAVTYICILKACATIGAIDKGEEIHDNIVRQGLLQNDIVLGNALVDMYAKCGALSRAQDVFEKLPSRNVVSWSALISGYVQAGQGEQALNCFERMKCEGILPNAVTYICILKACAAIGAADTGEEIHDNIVRQGLLQNDFVLGTALVDMYVKCGAPSKAQDVLEKLPSRNVVSWSALIAGYAQAGQGEQALNCFERMQCEGIPPNAVTYTCILKACATIGAADKGKEIHDNIARQGLLQNDIVLGTALMDMYAKCGDLSKAQDVLEKLPSQDVVSWNALIAGYAQTGQGEQVLKCFERMQREGIPPNAVTYICILKACANTGAADKGKEIHDIIVRQGLLHNDIVLGTALVDMYAKCGALSKAQAVLEKLPSRNAVSWSTLITGYAQEGQGEQALSCFERMQHEGFTPNAMTYISVLQACATIGAIDKGKEIHDSIARQGLLQNDIVLGTALVDMYAKCGALSKAQDVLEKLPSQDVVSWNALIAGYTQEGQAEQALNCFERMQREGIPPNAVTYICILKACASIGATDKGKEIHDIIVRQGLLQNDIVLGTALVDMYAKCGALSKAQDVIDKLPSRDVFSWNALITGYAQEGRGEQALKCFELMQHEGIPPNVVTFLCGLNLCSHLGLVEEGHALFMNMSTKFGVKPSLECYTCMVDLLGRAGHLEKAVRLIQEMPSSDDSATWLALLGACHKWGDINVGRWAFEQAVEADESDGPAYVLMANIYAAAGMQENAKNIETMSIRNKAWKKPGRSL